MATIKVCGSYYSPEESAILYAQVLDDVGEPANTAIVTLNLYKEDNTKLIDNASMSYIPSSNGLYKYGFVAPSEVQRMIADVKSTNPTAYGTEDLSVTDWTEDIATLDIIHGSGSWEGATPEELDEKLSAEHGQESWEGTSPEAILSEDASKYEDVEGSIGNLLQELKALLSKAKF